MGIYDFSEIAEQVEETCRLHNLTAQEAVMLLFVQNAPLFETEEVEEWA